MTGKVRKKKNFNNEMLNKIQLNENQADTTVSTSQQNRYSAETHCI